MKCAVRVNQANTVRKKQVFPSFGETKQLKGSVILRVTRPHGVPWEGLIG
jgi:hypothetical protein